MGPYISELSRRQSLHTRRGDPGDPQGCGYTEITGCIIHIKEPVMTIHSRTGTESNRIQRSFKLPKLPDESRRTYTLRSGTYKQAGLTTHMSGEKAGDPDPAPRSPRYVSSVKWQPSRCSTRTSGRRLFRDGLFPGPSPAHLSPRAIYMSTLNSGMARHLS